MSDFKKGFFSAPKKQESETQQQYEKAKKQQKKIHASIINLGGETQELGEVRPTPGGLRIQSFQTNEHGIAHQSSTKPPEEVKKLRKEISKLIELINNGLQDKLIQGWSTRRGKSTPNGTTNESSSARKTPRYINFKFKPNRLKTNYRAKNNKISGITKLKQNNLEQTNLKWKIKILPNKNRTKKI